jgi:predicted nucleic acid-binding protein
MSKKSIEPKILLDADVIIHFIKAGKQLLLPKIYPERFVILEKVYSEITAIPSKKVAVDNFIFYSKIPVISTPENRDIIKEYALLKKGGIGAGEAICMAVARYTKEYIASSNLKDIRVYCELHSIVYLTTMDVLLEAYRLGIMTEVECDTFIKEVKSKESKLIKGIDSITVYEGVKNRF